MSEASLQEASLRAKSIRLLALDVDGVLTDGSLYFGADGESLKAFNSLDGHGLKMLQGSGVTLAIITGRTSDIVARRANELGIDIVVQGREDKLTALQEVAKTLSLSLDQVAYAGDDLPDLSAIMAAGLGIAVANAASGVAAGADYLTTASGGAGAVREICEFILAAQGNWDAILTRYYQANSADSPGGEGSFRG